jgi:hypothetical protein
MLLSRLSADTGGYLLTGAGAVLDKRLFDSRTVFPYNPTYADFYGGFCYKFSNNFSLGVWAGLMYNVPPPIIGGLRLVFFNIDDLALNINIGIVPSLGVSYKGLSINGMIGLIETDATYGIDGLVSTLTYIRPYLEVGYMCKIF